MVASVNGDDFLRDHTGDRRFWVVDLGHRVIDTEKISKDRDRIWKAAIAKFRQGLSPCLSHTEHSVSDRRKRASAARTFFSLLLKSSTLASLKRKALRL